MPQVRFCSKCGASVNAGKERCRLCRTPTDTLPFVAVSAVAHADTGASPFVSMWLRPRDTIRRIVRGDPSHLVLPLAAAGGLFQTLTRASDKNAGDLLSLPVVLLLAVTLGPVFGIIGLYIGGALLHFTGRWLGGAGSREEIRASIAWGTVPALWGGLLWVPILALAGHAIFRSDFGEDEANAIALLITGGMLLVQAGAYVWSVFTGLHSLAEVQGFSAWRALGNATLGGLVLLVPVVGVAIVLAVVLPMMLMR
jgi:hypothetical protein